MRYTFDLIDKAWILKYIAKHGEKSPQVANMIGRALVALWERQTADEKCVKDARHDNRRGFSKADAPFGTQCAEYFMTNKTLRYDMMDEWLKPWGKRGYPRIAKYSMQLNEVALEKHGPKKDPKLEELKTLIGGI